MPTLRGVKAGSAYVSAFLDSTQFDRQLTRLGKRVSNIGRTLTRAGAGIFTGGAAALGGIGAVSKIFSDFDDQMRKVRAVTGAAEADFANLTEQAKELGRTTSFTASQIAGLQLELGRAGFNADEIINATEAIQNLGRATDTELAQAAGIAAATIRQFNLEATEAGRVADVLTATANGSAQTLEDLGNSMAYVGPIANQAKLTLEQTASIIGLLANNGIKGSAAGTALRKALLSIPNQVDALKQLNVDAVDAQGNILPLNQILGNLFRATASLGTGDRLKIFSDIFGERAAGAASIAGTSAEQIDAFTSSLENAEGTAKAAAQQMDAGLGGAVRRLLSAFEGVAIAVGNAAAPLITEFADAVSTASGFITQLVEKNPGLVRGLITISSAAVAFGAALIGLGIPLTILGVAISGIGSLIGVVTFAIGGFIGLLSAAASVAVAVVGAIFAPIATLSALISAIAAPILAIGTALAALITAIVSPIGIATAAIVGLGVYAATTTGLIGGIVTKVGEVQRSASDLFRTLLADVKVVFGGIVDAINSGDIQNAVGILWAGVRVEWYRGLEYLSEKGFLSVLDSIRDNFALLMDGLTNTSAVAWDGIRRIWSESTRFLLDVWEGIANPIRDSADSLFKSILKSYNAYKANGDEQLLSDLNADLDASYLQAKEKRHAESDKRILERDRKASEEAAALEKKLQDRLKAIRNQSDEEFERAQKQREGREQRIRDKRIAAQIELNERLARARAEGNKELVADLEKQIDDQKKQAALDPERLRESGTRVAAAVNSAAALRLGGSGGDRLAREAAAARDRQIAELRMIRGEIKRNKRPVA